jgi:hypothetical protein
MCNFQFHEMKRNLRLRRHIDTTRLAHAPRLAVKEARRQNPFMIGPH